jgi:hypothetical protein
MRVDRPIEKREEDLFGRNYYAKALAQCVEDFVTRHETPITLGVQGDWGSGKTSLLNLIKLELGESYLLVDFNSWVFANELNIGGELIFRVADKIIKSAERAKKDSIVAQLQESLKYVIQLGESVAMGLLRSRGVDVSECRKKNFDAIQFKEYFCNAVEEVLTASDKKAVVIFIDDLDLVPPGKAIEITESIKNFLDVPGCIFFISCDYALIQKGLKVKLGFEENSREAQQYLDKIFQIPFRMPLYTEGEIKHYLYHCFAEEKFDETQIDNLNSIVATLEMDNPRTLKRILGIYKLLTQIQSQSDADEKLNLLALIILQQYSLPIYHYLATAEEPVELLAQVQETQERDRGRYFHTLLSETQESEDKLRHLVELLQENAFMKEWLQRREYEKYFYLTALTDTAGKQVKRRSKWNKSKVLDFINTQIQAETMREAANGVLQMLLDLAKTFPAAVATQYPKARAFVDYGRGLAPSVLLKVSNRRGSRTVVVFSIWRNDGEFWFFLWGKPENTSQAQWDATMNYFRRKIFPGVFTPPQNETWCVLGKLHDMQTKEDTVELLRRSLHKMMEVRLRPESVLYEEELKE